MIILTEDGLYGMGDNYLSNLGIVDENYISKPTKIPFENVENIRRIYCHSYCSVIVTNDEIYIAGSTHNYNGTAGWSNFETFTKINITKLVINDDNVLFMTKYNICTITEDDIYHSDIFNHKYDFLDDIKYIVGSYNNTVFVMDESVYARGNIRRSGSNYVYDPIELWKGHIKKVVEFMQRIYIISSDDTYFCSTNFRNAHQYVFKKLYLKNVTNIDTFKYDTIFCTPDGDYISDGNDINKLTKLPIPNLISISDKTFGRCIPLHKYNTIGYYITLEGVYVRSNTSITKLPLDNIVSIHNEYNYDKINKTTLIVTHDGIYKDKSVHLGSDSWEIRLVKIPFDHQMIFLELCRFKKTKSARTNILTCNLTDVTCVGDKARSIIRSFEGKC